MSKEQKYFLKRYKLSKLFIFLIQISIVILFLGLWEFLSYKKVINPFIFSSPTKVLKCIIKLYNDGNLFKHIFITLEETCIAFLIGLIISIILATILYLNNFIISSLYKL